MEERGGFFSLLNRGRWRTGPGWMGRAFLPQSVIFFVWFVTGASLNASIPEAAQMGVKMHLPCKGLCEHLLAATFAVCVVPPPVPASLPGGSASHSALVCLPRVLFSAEDPPGMYVVPDCAVTAKQCDRHGFQTQPTHGFFGGGGGSCSALIRPWLCRDPLTKKNIPSPKVSRAR